MQFQQRDNNGGWAFSSADSTPDISYLITGATESIVEDSLDVNNMFTADHPMQGNGFWGQQA
jgi:hypothetical protein